MLETGAELAMQVLVVGSLLMCTEKPCSSVKWARLYPEDAWDQIWFWPPRASCRGPARKVALAAAVGSRESSERAVVGWCSHPGHFVLCSITFVFLRNAGLLT